MPIFQINGSPMQINNAIAGAFTAINYDPLITSPLLWLDSSDGYSIQYASGTDVSIWYDKSGNGNDASMWRSNLNPVDTGNGIQFDVCTYLLTPQLMSGTGAREFIVVAEHTGPRPTGASPINSFYISLVIVNDAPVAGPSIYGRLWRLTGEAANRVYQTAQWYDSSINQGETLIYDCHHPADASLPGMILHKNGILQQQTGYSWDLTIDTSPGGPGTMIGGGGYRLENIAVDLPDQYLDGKIKELFFWDRELHKNERTAIKNYLANKWLKNDVEKLSPIAWYDMSDSNTMTLSGSNILVINDLSGNANHLRQPNSVNQAIFSSGAVYVSQGIANVWYDLDSSLFLSDYDIFVVRTNLPATRTTEITYPFYGSNSSEDASDGGLGGIFSHMKYRVWGSKAGAGFVLNTTSWVPPNDWTIDTSILNTKTLFEWNKDFITDGVNTEPFPTGVHGDVIFNIANFSRNFPTSSSSTILKAIGYTYESIIFKRKLTDFERTLVKNYLTNKHNL